MYCNHHNYSKYNGCLLVSDLEKIEKLTYSNSTFWSFTWQLTKSTLIL